MPQDGERRQESRVDSPRAGCYDEIRNRVWEEMEAYYRQHPRRALDQRGQEKQDLIVRILKDVFTILNGYEIKKKGE
jgi:hypothetical protein